MKLPLLRKEIREHRWMGLAIAALQGLAIFGIVGQCLQQRTSPLEAVRGFAIVISNLGAWAITHRLIAREYTSRTQLFLETLPVSRARVLVVKWVLGALYVLGMLGICLAVSTWLARGQEQLTARRVVLIAIRAGSFALLGYAVFAAFSLLGRYRVACAVAALFGVFVLNQLVQLDFARWGPALLVADDLPYERHLLPLHALWITWAWIAALGALAFLLALVREGTLQAMLAERMSHREKVFLGCVGFSLMFAAYLLQELKQPEPFAITQGAKATIDGVEVRVEAGSAAERERAQALASHVATLLAGARQYLGLRQLPPVSILPSHELGPEVFERAELHERDGLVVRARLGDPQFDASAFDVWVLGQALTWASREPYFPEDRQWIADGFSWWWVTRDGPEADRALLELRAAYGAAQASGLAALRTWFTTREDLGPCVSGAVAYGAVEALERTVGADRLHAFLSSALGWTSPRSVRVLWMRPTLDALLRKDAGLEPDAFARAWAQATAAWVQAMQPRLTGTFRLRGEVQARRLSAASLEARYRASHVPAGEPYQVIYELVAPIDGPLNVPTAYRELVAAPDDQWHALPRTLSPGQRLSWTLSAREPVLQCSVWSGIRRQVLR